MVNWRDPATVAAEELAFIRPIHVTGGIYIWEIIAFIGFEYSVIWKKRKFTWSFLLYLGCRWFPLFFIASQFLGFDTSHKINCQAWIIFSFLSGYLSFMCASALIILRVAILWNRNKTVIAFACAVWICNMAIDAYSLTTLHSAWTGSFCGVSHTERLRISVLSNFITDVILLVLMLIGLRRWKNASKSFGVWGLLYTQGLIWVMIVTLAEIPPTVFILLNLNDPMNMIFQALSLIITALGAARLYRGLIDYPASNSSVKVVSSSSGRHSELVSPFSHQTHRKAYRAKIQHDAGGGSIVLDNLNLPVKTSDSEVTRGEMSEDGNVV
ncbi:hypothetical protein EDB86DRAFT_1244775 [Lactarius hatsudake]|nr:hypothetical protein EDB86DRAFT_1244775 [Lactarius hatsudake]